MIFLLVICPINCFLYLIWVLVKYTITCFLIRCIFITIFEVSRLYTSSQFTQFRYTIINLSYLETSLNGLKVTITVEKTFISFLRNYSVSSTQFLSVISNNYIITRLIDIVCICTKYSVDFLLLYIIKLCQHVYIIRLKVIIKNFSLDKSFREKLNFIFSNTYTTVNETYTYYLTKYHLVLNRVTSIFFFYGMARGKNWWENLFLFMTFAYQQTLPKIYRYMCVLFILIIGYFTIKFILPQSYICIKIDILKYFYNSLYLHTLFAYVAILCTLYSFCTIHFDYLLDLYYSVRFTLYMIWSLFFYTPEDLENLAKHDSDVKL
jgi:hypothetical protein